jgi:hypothetical protein
MEQFRPNLVVTGAAAWEEDTWKVIRIGEVIFDVANLQPLRFDHRQPGARAKASFRRTAENAAAFPHRAG